MEEKVPSRKGHRMNLTLMYWKMYDCKRQRTWWLRALHHCGTLSSAFLWRSNPYLFENPLLCLSTKGLEFSIWSYLLLGWIQLFGTQWSLEARVKIWSLTRLIFWTHGMIFIPGNVSSSRAVDTVPSPTQWWNVVRGECVLVSAKLLSKWKHFSRLLSQSIYFILSCKLNLNNLLKLSPTLHSLFLVRADRPSLLNSSSGCPIWRKENTQKDKKKKITKSFTSPTDYVN